MQSVIQFKQAIRPLHWVVKISDLKQSIKLLETLGCRILRHEEFEEGCAASCNGPYAGFWSKTMIGFDNEDNSFVFELTYNYGVFEYKRGNDLKSINLHKFNKNGEDIEAKLNKEFPDVQKNNDGIYEFINSDFVFKFVDSKASNDQLISGLTFNCLD